MSIVSRWVLIPAKSSWLAKQRLGAVITAEQRIALAHYFLDRLLSVLDACRSHFTAIVVVTIDPSLADIAQRHRAIVVPDPPDADLNGVLAVGRTYALAQGATELLVLPTDLPYLTPAALDAFLHPTGGRQPVVTIAPDEQGEGTNALLLRPPTIIPFRFGVGSAALHRRVAEQAGIAVRIIDDAALARDMDRPADWLRWQQDVGDPLPRLIHPEQRERDSGYPH